MKKISKTVKQSFWSGLGTGLGLSIAMAIGAIIVSILGLNTLKSYLEKREGGI